ncbi:MAG: protein serine/threonine phosphatase 2C family protein [Spirochaetia bacterium]|nr:protein serine/threonine phosphatase 2C family protein [Spirochaetia bacterium]
MQPKGLLSHCAPHSALPLRAPPPHTHTRPCFPRCRSVGDIEFKEPLPLLTARPDVTATSLQPGADQFVIYASDGVWCVLSDQEAVDCVAEALQGAAGEPDGGAATAARALVQLAKGRGSKDDITALVSVFQWES